jgi:hypothetical protein
MLTATIEQKCSASIKHRAFSSAAHTHTHNNSESLLDHFVKDLTERLQQKSQLQDRSSVSATVTNNTKITTVCNNKHLDGGLRSHFFFFSPKKQTHTQNNSTKLLITITNIVQLEHHFP